MGRNQQATDPTTPKPTRARRPIVLWSAALLAVTVLTMLVAWWTDRRSEQRLWSLLPHTMGCAPNPYDPFPVPPPSVRAQQVRMEHLDSRRIAVTVTFFGPPPPTPVPVSTGYGEVRNRPGGLNYTVAINDPQSDGAVVTYSPSEGRPWRAVMISTRAVRSVDFDDRPEVPLEVSLSGNEVRLVLNIPEDSELLKHQVFAPSITIQSTMTDPSVLANPESIGIMFQPYECEWSTPVAVMTDMPLGTLPPQASAPPARVPRPQPAAGFPPGSRPCPRKYGATGSYTRSAVGNDQTSCPFAEEVRISYADMGAPGSVQQIKVFSPSTQQMYDVTCQPTGSVIVCTGGNGAVVYLN